MLRFAQLEAMMITAYGHTDIKLTDGQIGLQKELRCLITDLFDRNLLQSNVVTESKL